MISGLITSLLGTGMNIVDKFVEDKDKKAELGVKTHEMMLDFAKTLISTQTYPWVDAVVKLMYAVSDLLKQNWRPMVSGFAFIYGLFNPEAMVTLHEAGTVGDGAIAGIFGAFPGWILSRHQEKKRTNGDV